MKAPIIVNDSARADRSGDVRVYPTIDGALGSLEPNDAYDPNLHVFDGEGKRLKIVIGSDGRSVSLVEAGQHPDHAQNLASLLKEFLKNVGVDDQWTARASLKELISKAIKDYPAEY